MTPGARHPKQAPLSNRSSRAGGGGGGRSGGKSSLSTLSAEDAAEVASFLLTNPLGYAWEHHTSILRSRNWDTAPYVVVRLVRMVRVAWRGVVRVACVGK